MSEKNKYKVLIVEDEKDLLAVLEDEFKYYGYSVHVSSNGHEAIELLKKEKVDLILSDFKMPNGNGMTLLNYVNTMEDRPIFFFISGGYDISEEDCQKLGVRQSFAKPFSYQQLFSEIEKELSLNSKTKN